MSLGNDCANTTMLVEPSRGNGGNGMGWGGDWAAWIVLFLIFGIFGWGGFGNSFGGGFGGGINAPAGQGALTRGDLCMDMSFQDVKEGVAANSAAMQAGFRNIDNAICQLGYNDAQLINGVERQIGNEFRGVDNAICTLGYNVQQGFNAATIANLQGQNALQSQLAGCCCDVREAISGVNYNAAMTANATQGAIRDGFCQTNYNAQTNTRDIIEAQNANTRAILDKLTAQEIAAKDATIAAQNQRLFAAELAASQAAQTNSLVNQLRPCPIPSYQTCNPWAGSSYGGCGCAA